MLADERKRTTALWRIIASCAMGLALWPHHAVRADDATNLEQAGVHFDRGIELIEENAYDAAAVELERAYQLSHDDTVLYNLGMAYAAAGRPVEASAALARYLEHTRATLPAQEVGRIEDELRRQNARIGSLALDVDPQGARIEIDGRLIGTTPLTQPIALAVGRHDVQVTASDYETATETVAIAGQQQLQVRFVLTKKPGAPLPSPTPLRAVTAAPQQRAQVAYAPSSGASSQRPIAYAIGGVGIGAGVAALVVYLVGDARHDEWQTEKLAIDGLAEMAASEPYDAETDREIIQRTVDNNRLLKSVWQLDTLATGLAIGGGALLTTGVVLLLTASNDGEPAKATAALALQGTTFQLTVRY